MIWIDSINDKKKLFKQLEKISYNERLAYMAKLGRTIKDQKRYHKLLEELVKMGEYEAHLALQGARVIKDTEVVCMALRHPDRTIRCIAAKTLGILGSDEDIEREIFHLSIECRKKLYGSMLKHKRTTAAEKIISKVKAQFGVHEAIKLLSICSKQTVKAWLLECREQVRNWRNLARVYPDLVLENLEEEIASGSKKEKQYIWYRYWDGIEYLTAYAPEKMLEYGIQIHPQTLYNSKQLSTLAKQYQEQVVRLLTCDDLRTTFLSRGIPNRLLANQNDFSIEQWIQIIKPFRDEEGRVTHIFSKLAPSKRAVLFEAIYPKAQRQNKIFSTYFMGQLPHALREEEAMRMMALREVKENPEQLQQIMACLPIEKARAFLEQGLHQSKVEERANSVELLIQCTQYSKTGMLQTLQTLCGLKNDQDRVKQTMMEALAHCPARQFKPEYIEVLQVLVDSVVGARDLSSSTAYALKEWLFNLIRCHEKDALFHFAVDGLIKCIKKEGNLSFPSFNDNMPKGIEVPLFEALFPYLKRENKKENYQLTLNFARALGKRAYKIQALQQLVRQAIGSKYQYEYVKAIKLWLACNQTRDDRVRELLDEDLSFIAIEPVFLHVHQKRQEWLTPFITGSVIKGRFLTGQTIYRIPANKGFFRWLPNQQETFCKLLERVIYSDDYQLVMRIEAINAIAHMPAIPMERLMPLLSQENVEIVKATLQALSYRNEPEKDLKVLLDYIEGNHAGIAMYAIPRCMRYMEPSCLFDILKETLERPNIKLTAKKEVIRLLATYQCTQSIKLLESLVQTQTHKDILIAIGYAAKSCLQEEGAWHILEQLAKCSEKDVLRGVFTSYFIGTKKERARFLELVIEVSKNEDIDVSQEVIYSMKNLIEGNEERVAAYMAECLSDLKTTTKWRAAKSVLLSSCEEESIHPVIVEIFKMLIKASEDERNCLISKQSEERDLPAQQRMLALIEGLRNQTFEKRSKMSNLYVSICELLVKDEALYEEALQLIIASMNWNDTEACLQNVSRMEKYLTLAPYLMRQVYSDLKEAVQKEYTYFQPECLIICMGKMQEMGGMIAYYLSLTVLEVVGKKTSWQPECISLLIKGRECEHAVVRTQANKIFYVSE